MGIDLDFPNFHGSFNLLHAVAAGLSDRDGIDGGREFLKPGKRNIKQLAAERSLCLERLPSPPARHPDVALWSAFLGSVGLHGTKLPVEFTDSWLMETIWTHAWLGHFWEYDDRTVYHLMGQMSVREVLAIHLGIQIAVLRGPVQSTSSSSASSSLVLLPNSQAISFVVPEPPLNGVEIIRNALLDKFGRLAPVHPTGCHSADPMGIDYSARIVN
jgi:hypothetical protein